MGFAGLNTAVSGIRAAQLGLGVTGHNMSNGEILGYSRQRVLQKDYWYNSMGYGADGNPLQRGLGTDWNAISQIRNEFLDYAYRQASSKLTFYSVKTTAGGEIENQLGEMQGADNFQSIIQNMWYSIEELTAHPQGVETRDNFLATCGAFVTKANEVYNGLLKYQRNLDQQVRQAVNDVNSIVGRIKELNIMIKNEEMSGDNANDYRDERNLCLDKLSEIIEIDYKYDMHGDVSIFSEGRQLLSQNSQTFMGLRYTSSDYSYVEPVLVGGKPQDKILSAHTSPPYDFVQYINYDKPINSDRDNDYGVLKGLLVARGAMPAYYLAEEGLHKPIEPGTTLDIPDTPENRRIYQAELYNEKMQKWSVKNCIIPKTMIKLDQIFHSIVTMINDLVAPADGPDPDNPHYVEPQEKGAGRGVYEQAQADDDDHVPFDNNGNRSYVEVFIRRPGPGNYTERWIDHDNDPDTPPTLVPEEKGNYYSQYSIGNVEVNPKLLETEDGYNLLALSYSGDIEDTRLLNDLQKLWKSNSSVYAVNVGGIDFNMDDAYNKFVSQLSTEVAEAKSFVEAQTVQVERAEYKRQTIMGVSMEEELTTMMKYQYAFQGAARILNVIDSMIDQVVNRTGRVGL
jgi:flagellar hook-associated protein 1 FlgK